MNHLAARRSSLMVCAVLAGLVLRPAWAESPKALTPEAEADQHVALAEKTFENFWLDPGQDFFRKQLAKAKGVLIIPASARLGFIFSGAGGRGVLVARNDSGKWTGPAFYTLSYASVGLQVGLQVSEVIVLVMSQSGINSLLSSSFRGGGDAAIAAGPVGTGTQSSFQGDFISVYRSKVLYGGLNLDLAVLSANDAWNTGFYGKPTTSVDILVRHEASSPKGEGLLNAVSAAVAESAEQQRAAEPKAQKTAEPKAEKN
ncbi:MAG TPA: lipid-binding SYLF domain-containing protein [Burkholderiales bacterium]|nr:lipid-binding SYLF domain-containing protein [Burkholderiales bacterium]